MTSDDDEVNRRATYFAGHILPWILGGLALIVLIIMLCHYRRSQQEKRKRPSLNQDLLAQDQGDGHGTGHGDGDGHGHGDDRQPIVASNNVSLV